SVVVLANSGQNFHEVLAADRMIAGITHLCRLTVAVSDVCSAPRPQRVLGVEHEKPAVARYFDPLLRADSWLFLIQTDDLKSMQLHRLGIQVARCANDRWHSAFG